MKTIKQAIAETPLAAKIIPVVYITAAALCYILLGTPGI